MVSPNCLAPRLAPTALLLAALLAGCGGGAEPPTAQAAAAPERRQALAEAAALVGPDVIMEWAEFKFPTLFRAGPQTLARQGPTSFPLSYLGTDYTVRAYPGERYLGITDAGQIYGLGDYTGGALTGFGNTGDYVAQMLADARPQGVGVMLVSSVGAGEQFRFALQGATAATVGAQGVPVALGTLRSGDSYTVNQTDGPRACTLSANRSGMVGFRDIVVTADCGRPPGQSQLAGELRAPVGAQVTLQLNGGRDLTVTVPALPGSIDGYNAVPFAFEGTLADGATYQVSVKSAPAGQGCSVYTGASGTMPVASGGLRVGCELLVDFVSRSGNGATPRGNFFNSRDLVIGGAAGPVGRTPVGYGEGRFVAFVTYAEGVAGSTGRHRQVFWRDRFTNETLLISATAAGEEGNNESFAPALSTDGLTVAFESYATNLAPGDTNGARDIFVWQANSRHLGAQRVSVGEGGVQANSESFEPTLSGDGRWLAFTTSASNLVPGVSGTSVVNVVLRDLAGGSNRLVSANAKGEGVGGSRPMLSEDGNRLAFYSFAADLVPGDANELWDIFVLDRGAGTLRRVSLTAGGGERNQGVESRSRVVAPALSGNGRYVAWATTATNVVAGDTNGIQDLFVTDLDAGTTRWVSSTAAGTAGNGDSPVGQGERVSLSYDGQWITYTTAATDIGVQAGQVVLRHLGTGAVRPMGKAGGTSSWPMLSRDAAFVAYGQSVVADPRVPGSGLYAEFTGLGRAWWWVD